MAGATPLTCPECGGVLWELKEGALVHYSCHLGHTFSVESLEAEQEERAESALWAGVQALAEQAALSHRMAERLAGYGNTDFAQRYARRAEEAEAQAEVLRGLLGGAAAANLGHPGTAE